MDEHATALIRTATGIPVLTEVFLKDLSFPVKNAKTVILESLGWTI